MSKNNLLSKLNFTHILLTTGIVVILLISFHGFVLTNLPHYIVIIWGILILVFSIAFIVFFNYKATKPFADILELIKSKSDLNIDYSNLPEDYKIISRYIDNLENKLSFYEKKIDVISVESKRLESDLKLANRLQKNLFPANTPLLADQNKFEICAYSESAFDVGGDLYDCFLIDDDHLFVVVADVAGKGIAASLYMIYTHTLLRSIVKPGLSVTDIIGKLNNQLIDENISDMFVTMFVGIFNLPDGKFEFCNAAHSCPCMISVTGNVEELALTHGIPVGIYPNRTYQSSTIIFKPGDQVFIYTDGLTDTVDENGVKYTTDVLRYNLMGSWFNTPSEVIDKIKNSVEYFRGHTKPVDDMTILILKYTLNS